MKWCNEGKVELLVSGPYGGPLKSHYLFVDGGSLRGKIDNLSRKYFGNTRFDLDFQALYAFPITKGFYYDAVPVRKDDETEAEYNLRVEPILAVFKAAVAVDRIHVYEGDARRRKRQGHIQKKVDVMLTVDMLTHSFRGNMQEATLLAGDLDFKPLIDALVQNGTMVTLWYPSGETSQELIEAADIRRPLTMQSLFPLLTQATREYFRIPVVTNHPTDAVPFGNILRQWEAGGKKHSLSVLNHTYTATREIDHNQTYHIVHDNLELLTEYCLECYGFQILT